MRPGSPGASAPTGLPLPATSALDSERADVIIVPGAAGRVIGDNGEDVATACQRACGTPASRPPSGSEER
jgi:hypothetical protein